jgi:SOS response associated peptidase (SRAP)
LITVRWGLVPFWADDLSIGNRLINARCETVHSYAKPTAGGAEADLPEGHLGFA